MNQHDPDKSRVIPAVPVQLPSVGRMVHHFVSDTGDPENLRPNSAIIVAVHNATCVDLFVMDPAETSPYFAYSITQGNNEGQWNWPPRV